MLALALVLACLASGTPRQEATPQRDFQVEQQKRHASMIRRLMRRGDAAAVQYIVKSLEHGLPPAILGAFVDGARENPKAPYVPHLRRLTRHRTRHLRARAMVALAKHGEALQTEATLAALDDSDLDIRFLGLELVTRYTTPALEEAAIALLARDEKLAELAELAKLAAEPTESENG